MKRCDRCGKTIHFGWMYAIGSDRYCCRCMVLRWPLLRRSLLTALVVGTFLTAVNQGNTLLDGAFSPDLAWKVALTYATPFFVATWGALINARMQDPV